MKSQEIINEIVATYLPAELFPFASLILFCISIWVVREWWLLGEPGNPTFEKRIEQLKIRKIHNSYFLLLKYFLTYLEGWLGPTNRAKNRLLSKIWISGQPFTGNSFEKLILLGITYPVLFAIFSLLVTSQAKFGNLGISSTSLELDFWFLGLYIFILSISIILKKYNIVIAIFIASVVSFILILPENFDVALSILMTLLFLFALNIGKTKVRQGVFAISCLIACSGISILVHVGSIKIALFVLPIIFLYLVCHQAISEVAIKYSQLGNFWIISWLFLLIYIYLELVIA